MLGKNKSLPQFQNRILSFNWRVFLCVREGSKERKRETGALGKLSWWSLSRLQKYKMLWVTNSSHLHFQTSCLGSHGQWVFTPAREANLRPSAIGPRPLALTATTSVFSAVCKMKSWKFSFKDARSNKRMCLPCGCSSCPYRHVLHLFQIILTSSLCVSRLSFPPVPEPHIWIIMFEFGPGCLFPTGTTLH